MDQRKGLLFFMWSEKRLRATRGCFPFFICSECGVYPGNRSPGGGVLATVWLFSSSARIQRPLEGIIIMSSNQRWRWTSRTAGDITCVSVHKMPLTLTLNQLERALYYVKGTVRLANRKFTLFHEQLLASFITSCFVWFL